MTVALLIGPILMLVLFAPGLLDLWLGAQVAAAAGNATRILAIGLLFNAAAFVPSTYLSALGRPDISAKFHMFEIVIHLPLAWWLVTRYGIVGAASAWTIRVIFDAILLFWAARRLLRSPRAGRVDAGDVAIQIA
jgi:O-antigen/teichoic acid export membrane protein